MKISIDNCKLVLFQFNSQFGNIYYNCNTLFTNYLGALMQADTPQTDRMQNKYYIWNVNISKQYFKWKPRQIVPVSPIRDRLYLWLMAPRDESLCCCDTISCRPVQLVTKLSILGMKYDNSITVVLLEQVISVFPTRQKCVCLDEKITFGTCEGS